MKLQSGNEITITQELLEFVLIGRAHFAAAEDGLKSI